MIAVAAGAALAGLAALAGGCGGEDADPDARVGSRIDAVPGQPDAVPRLVIDELQPLVPGELAEAIMTGGPDDYAVIHLEAPAMELDWNIHGHADGETQVVHEQFNVMGADYVFVPPGEADWYLLVRNSGPVDMDVRVRVALYGDLTWRWQ